MAKYALIVRDIEPPQGRGKVAHALTNALSLTEAGHEAKVFFEGQGVEWLRLFHEREDNFVKHYGARFDEAHEKGLIGGSCNFCTKVRFKVADHAEHWGCRSTATTATMATSPACWPTDFRSSRSRAPDPSEH